MSNEHQPGPKSELERFGINRYELRTGIGAVALGVAGIVEQKFGIENTAIDTISALSFCTGAVLICRRLFYEAA